MLWEHEVVGSIPATPTNPSRTDLTLPRAMASHAPWGLGYVHTGLARVGHAAAPRRPFLDARTPRPWQSGGP